MCYFSPETGAAEEASRDGSNDTGPSSSSALRSVTVFAGDGGIGPSNRGGSETARHEDNPRIGPEGDGSTEHIGESWCSGILCD